MNFQVGDLVQLKSGGPLMTVHYVGEKKFPHGGKAPTVSCTWFEGPNVKKESFNPATLVAAEKQA